MDGSFDSSNYWEPLYNGLNGLTCLEILINSLVISKHMRKMLSEK